jgi:hypothetical protein
MLRNDGLRASYNITERVSSLLLYQRSRFDAGAVQIAIELLPEKLLAICANLVLLEIHSNVSDQLTGCVLIAKRIDLSKYLSAVFIERHRV